jgi:hypothetical protein
VKDGVDASGTKLQIWNCGSGNRNQMWVEGVEGDGETDPGLHIQWAGHGRCVDLTGGSQASGTPVSVLRCYFRRSLEVASTVKKTGC